MGSTHHIDFASRHHANHSHVCGINTWGHQNVDCLYESFPRMWDQPAFYELPAVVLRIIPTYVGSTYILQRKVHQYPNHSHVCGINKAKVVTASGLIESFPRMWDQRSRCRQRPRPHRIIPTYVGSTHGHRCDKRLASNHSHVCGINSHSRQYSHSSSESFPRMWDQLNLPLVN